MRSVDEQMVGLQKVAEAASKLHRVNLVIDPGPPGDVATLRCAGVADPGVEVVYAVGGYDLWEGSTRMMRTDLTVDEAAFAIATAYMGAKAFVVLMRDHGMSGEQAHEFLSDEAKCAEFFGLLDQGSDAMRAKLVQAATS